MTSVVFALVLGLRLTLPLAIPKYPLPFILAALVIDGVDQTIFQAVGAHSVLDNYQEYDKALDVYYLTIAYVSTFRNWLDPFDVGVARFLFYYRLLGVLLFELSGTRALLIVFPNTFEYFFIFYEAVRLGWAPARMSHRLVAGAAAAIWVFVKLPQEYWIHIAELDVTDEQAAHPWLLPAFFGALGLALAALWPQRRRLPPRDRTVALDVDAHIDRPPSCAVVPRADRNAILSMAVAEKVLLLGTIAVIFSQILEGARATDLQLTLGVVAVVVLNAIVSLVPFERESRYGSTALQFASTAVINGAIVGTGILLRRTAGVEAYLPAGDALVYLGLISLIITMYDRYRVIGNLSTDERPRLRDRLPIVRTA